MKIFLQKYVLSFFVLACGILFFILDYFGIIWHNDLFAARYPVKGLDVSHHQGDIDWGKVAAQKKYAFVYMKATEGHDFIDDTFQRNWDEAQKHGLFVGAYHFFSMRSSGLEQAQYFIDTVPYDPQALPPVIDIEIDVNKEKQKVQSELHILIQQLQEFYHKKPILYVTYDIYRAYIRGEFDSSNIWIRDIFFIPQIRNQSWTFWQYNNRGHVDGIRGYVDINVFRGSLSQLEELAQSTE